MPEIDLSQEHPATILRPPGSHEFVYTLVADRSPIGFEVPDELRTSFLRRLGSLPKSALQFANPTRYQRFGVLHNCPTPVRFGVIFAENFTLWSQQQLGEPAVLFVLFWTTNDTTAMRALAKITAPVVVVADDNEREAALIGAGVPQNWIIKEHEALLKRITAAAAGFLPLTPEQFAEKQKKTKEMAIAYLAEANGRAHLPFNPLTVNLDQLHQILGCFDPDLWIQKENIFAERPQAMSRSFTFVAEAQLSVSDFEIEGLKFAGRLPAVILAFPSLSPAFHRQLKDRLEKVPFAYRKIAKRILSARFTEQSTGDYQHMIMPPQTKQELQMIVEIAIKDVAAYTGFFDVVGYLHGSFNHAPYLRAPLKGASLAQELSFFAPNVFSPRTSPEAVRKRIDRLGLALSKTLHSSLQKKIAEYPAGAVALTDLPLEWMDLDGVPFAFLHDTCRIPESVITNLLSQFVRNRHSNFKIGPDILKRTLIVCGASDGDEITNTFEQLKAHHSGQPEGMPWRMERCLTRQDLYKMVNEFRPELLILDTHGRFSKNETGTELQFGGEFLNGEDVLANLPQVPLVILSACWGAPLYGCTNTIAHAFFEKGSFAVTTSLLPLEIFKGGMLYTRVLNNLRLASEQSLHANWASFMSHNVRTSYFDDMLEVLRDHYGPDVVVDPNNYVERRKNWQIATMFFSGRREAYQGAITDLLACINPILVDRARRLLEEGRFVPEFLFYTTLGRADLVPFVSWEKKKHKPVGNEVTVADVLAAEKVAAGTP